ncbi:MAG: hypothetical protein QY322_01040 [bacterium]|nr:MAG: hypothetical protein QY322_01040 [bacterium]
MGEKQLSDEDIKKILEESLEKDKKKKIPRGGDQRPIVQEEIIKENIKKKGKVWEEDKKGEDEQNQ